MDPEADKQKERQRDTNQQIKPNSSTLRPSIGVVNLEWSVSFVVLVAQNDEL